MLRRSAAWWMPLAEARALVAKALPDAAADRQALVPALIEAAVDHPAEGPLVLQVMQRLTEIDAEPADSFTIAQHTSSLHTLVNGVMRKHVKDVRILEHACRAIANVCLLPTAVFEVLHPPPAPQSAPSSTPSPSQEQPAEGSSPQPQAAQQQQQSQSFADLAVEFGALELVIGTMAAPARLTPKGCCWAATALQHLLMFASTAEATHVAARHGVEDVLATFLSEMSEEVLGLLNASSLSLLHLRLVAADAALGALARLMAAPAPDNARGVEVRSQQAHPTTVEAALRTMTAVLLASAALAEAEGGTMTAQGPAVAVRAASACHKAWEVLAAVSAHGPNLPMVYNAVHEAAEAHAAALTPATRRHHAAVSAAAAIEGTRSAHAFELCAAFTLLQVGALAGPQGAEAEEGSVAHVAALATAAALRTCTTMSAVRTDVRVEGESEEVAAARTIPTESAGVVVSCLTSGTLSAWALRGVRSAWASLQETAGGDKATAAAYAEAQLACGRLELLSNLLDAGDAVAAGPGTLTQLHAMADEYLQLLGRAQVALVAGGAAALAEHALRLVPVVGKALAVLWNALSTPTGADTLRTLETAPVIAGIAKTSGMLVQALQQRGEASEGIAEMARVADQLTAKLDAVVVNPVYVQNKHDKPKQQQ